MKNLYKDMCYKINNLKPFRYPVSIENGQKIVLLRDSIYESIYYYIKLINSNKISKLPDYILTDVEGEDFLYEYEMKLLNRYNINYFFSKDLKESESQSYCVYLGSDFELLKKYGTSKIYTILHNKGIKFCGYDMKYIHNNIPQPLFFKFFARDIIEIYSSLSDEISRDIFLRVCKSRITGDYGYLPFSSYTQYHHPEVSADPGDYVFEGGVLNGATTKEFSAEVGENGMVIAFEPVTKFWRESKKQLKNYKNVTIENVALHSSTGTFYIVDNGGGSFLQLISDKNAEKVYSIDIDSYIKSKKIDKFDLLKLDIEGSEYECLRGAIHSIERFRPKLQISIYHTEWQYITLAKFLSTILKNYHFYLGHHSFYRYETILYCEPIKSGSDRRKFLSQENCNIDCIYVGCGNAYNNRKHLYKNFHPICIALDESYIDRDIKYIDGIPVKTFQSLSNKQKQLNIFMCID